MSQEPVKIAIIMDGGLINQVMTAGVPVDVLIVDYDIEGADGHRLITLDEDGPAYVTLSPADDESAWVVNAFEKFKEA